MTPTLIETIRRTLEDSAHLRHLNDREKNMLAASIAIAVEGLKLEQIDNRRRAAARELADEVSDVLGMARDLLQVAGAKRGPVRGIGDRIWDNGEERRRLEAWSRFLRNHGIGTDPMPEVLDRWPVCRCHACRQGVWEMLPQGLREKLKAMPGDVPGGEPLQRARDAVWMAATGRPAPDGLEDWNRRRAWRLWRHVHLDSDPQRRETEGLWPFCLCDECASTWYHLAPPWHLVPLRAGREAAKEGPDA